MQTPGVSVSAGTRGVFGDKQKRRKQTSGDSPSPCAEAFATPCL
jgi:hypothetical protein